MRDFLSSSIGRKMVMAVTGLVLFGFVVIHMLGNLQIFLGREALNAYAHKLQSMPFLLWPARFFLLAALIIHIWFAAVLTIENRKARPTPYVFKDTVQASYASRTMMWSGVLVFLFIVYHLLHYTFGVAHPEVFQLADSKSRHDVYSMVVLSYQNFPISAVYVLAMAPLALHLSHGAAGFFQSLGFSDERSEPLWRAFAKTMAFLIFVGNSAIPVAVLLRWVKL